MVIPYWSQKLEKIINAIGLDYSVGFLHEINQSRTPLVL